MNSNETNDTSNLADEPTPSHETREYQSPVVIEDIESATGMTMEELIRNAVEAKMEAVERDPHFAEHIRSQYDIPAEMDIREGIEKKMKEKAAEYADALPRKTKEFREQAIHCGRIAREHGYISHLPEIHIVITDFFLADGKEDFPWADQYDHTTGKIYLQIESPNILAAHEVGHALSHSQKDENTHRIGFTVMEKNNDGEYQKNRWLNEGTTVLWQNMSVNDNSKLADLNEGLDHYGYYRDLTVLIMEEAGVPQEILFKAYFGDAEAMAFLEAKIQDRFHCTLENLGRLTLSTDIEWAKRIVHGETEVISIDKQAASDEDLFSRYVNLCEIFPNVKISIVNE